MLDCVLSQRCFFLPGSKGYLASTLVYAPASTLTLPCTALADRAANEGGLKSHSHLVETFGNVLELARCLRCLAATAAVCFHSRCSALEQALLVIAKDGS